MRQESNSRPWSFQLMLSTAGGFAALGAVGMLSAFGLLRPVSAAILLALCAAGGMSAVIWGFIAPIRRAERTLEDDAAPLKARLALLRQLNDPASRLLLSLADELEARHTETLAGTQAELDMLQSQINPHFLYNTLDSIRGQALHEGAVDIADMTEALSAFFRYSISNRNNVVTLAEELENVRDYFKIQQFRFDNRFQLSIQPTERENKEQCRLPKLALQPIVENAILHGLEGKTSGGEITVRIEGTDKLVIVTISDNGAGMENETLQMLRNRVRGQAIPEPADKRGGLALPNVARRIRLLYGDCYDVQVYSTLGQGTDVVLTLPRVTEETKTYGA
ncbi:MAG: sensor histidine kinase [Eubacteriales bacterium]|nr:sensor histidine kinase [Eubacteriales bacterium]